MNVLGHLLRNLKINSIQWNVGQLYMRKIQSCTFYLVLSIFVFLKAS